MLKPSVEDPTMRTGLVFVTVAIVMVAVAGLWSRSAGQPAAPAVVPVTRVAVCDVGKVLNGNERRAELLAQYHQKRTAANEEDKKRLAEIETIQKALKQNLKPNTKEYDQQLQKLQQLSIQRKVWREYEEWQFAREHRQLMEHMYGEILDAIAVIARQRGYHLVLYRDDVEVESETTSELLNKVAQRKCLYNDPRIDLTQPVTERLNQNFRARRAPRAP